MDWEPGATALVVDVPEAEPLRRAHGGADRVHAHITLVVPFARVSDLPPLLEPLRAVVATWAPAPFVLRRARVWPGLAWLEPDPAGPFVAMTNELVTRFGFLPYEGIHDEVIPHVSVTGGDDDAALVAVAEAVQPLLPIECAGDRVQLLELGGDLRWRERESWRLQSGSGSLRR